MIIVAVCLPSQTQRVDLEYIFRFQLVTRSAPFPRLTNFSVMIQVSDGMRPEKPQRFEAPGLTPDVWEIAETCWHKEPKERPEAHIVLQRLEDLASFGTDTHVRTHTPARGLLAGVRKGTHNGRDVALKSIGGSTLTDDAARSKCNVRYPISPPTGHHMTPLHRFRGGFVKRRRRGCR